uniref:COP9 signalosome complex subunit 9 n=1 Tax=Oryzias sinensis TaxID=183150 RepID=A0A8C7Y4J3_9TELE
MKPAVDEMFPEGAGPYVDLDEAGGSSGLLMDLAANEKAVHSDFFNGKDIFFITISKHYSESCNQIITYIHVLIHNTLFKLCFSLKI